MSRNSLLHVFVLSVLFISSTFIAMGKNPVLKNSKWKAVQEEFVADAGTMTITYTLEFLSGKEVRVHEESYLPAHAAMYMNPDGTVDRMPARSWENTETGTYTFRRGVLTITTEDGQQTEYQYEADGGFFSRKLPWGVTLAFFRDQE